MDLDGRLQKHRCSAPFAKYLESWPCRRVWERAAIDCLANGCEQVYTEVFLAASLDRFTTPAQAFFAMMPNLEAAVGDPETGQDQSTPA